MSIGRAEPIACQSGLCRWPSRSAISSRDARVQAADVGIRLEPRNPGAHDLKSAAEQNRHEAFLKQLRGRTPLVNLDPYAPWMSARTHRNLRR